MQMCEKWKKRQRRSFQKLKASLWFAMIFNLPLLPQGNTARKEPQMSWNKICWCSVGIYFNSWTITLPYTFILDCYILTHYIWSWKRKMTHVNTPNAELTLQRSLLTCVSVHYSKSEKYKVQSVYWSWLVSHSKTEYTRSHTLKAFWESL